MALFVFCITWVATSTNSQAAASAVAQYILYNRTGGNVIWEAKDNGITFATSGTVANGDSRSYNTTANGIHTLSVVTNAFSPRPALISGSPVTTPWMTNGITYTFRFVFSPAGGTNECVDYPVDAFVYNPGPNVMISKHYKNGVLIDTESVEPGTTYLFQYILSTCDGVVQLSDEKISVAPEVNVGIDGDVTITPGEHVVSTTTSSGGTGGGGGFVTTNITTQINPTNVLTGGDVAYAQMGSDTGKILGAGFNQLDADLKSLGLGQLGIIQAIESNGSGTNGGGSFPAGDPGAIAGLSSGSGATNGTVASANALDKLDGVPDGIDDAIASVTALAIPSGSGSPDMTINFYGREFNLDPVAMFPGLSNLCIYGISFVAAATFLFWLGQRFMQLVQIYSGAQLGGVPNQEVIGEVLGFGAGGNFLGIATALVVPGIFIALFVTALGLLFGYMENALVGWMGLTNFTDSMAGTAYYLLVSFFPLHFVVQLLMTRITLEFTLGKAVIIASSAARYLFGK